MMAGLKICGVTRPQDVDACRELGVDAIGINLWSGSKRGLSVPQAAAMLASSDATGLQRVGVFVQAEVEHVRKSSEALQLDAIQLHWSVDPRPYAALGIPWVWVVRGTPELHTLQVPEPSPAWALLDAAVPGFGGQGVRTDWNWAARAVQHLAPLPVWLAGGINPSNIAEAIDRVGPAGLDVASGAELAGANRGEKDRGAIETLVRACRPASS